MKADGNHFGIHHRLRLKNRRTSVLPMIARMGLVSETGRKERFAAAFQSPSSIALRPMRQAQFLKVAYRGPSDKSSGSRPRWWSP